MKSKGTGRKLGFLIMCVLATGWFSAGYSQTASLTGDTICAGGCGSLVTQVTGGTAPYSFLWSPGNVYTNGSIEVCPTITTTYQVIVTDAQGNSDTATAEVVVETPTYSADAGPDFDICIGDTVLLGGPPLAGNQYVYSWLPAAGLVDDSASATLASPRDTTVYVLTITDTVTASACYQQFDTAIVNVRIPFQVPPMEVVVACPGDLLEVGVEPEANWVFDWTPVRGLVNPYLAKTALHVTEGVNSYTLMVTDTTELPGCQTVPVPLSVVNEYCDLPNVMTPNGDGINDQLWLPIVEGRLIVTVFDRHGNQVYHSDAYQNDWSGTTSAGADVPEGVYYYTVRRPGSTTGSAASELTILR